MLGNTCRGGSCEALQLPVHVFRDGVVPGVLRKDVVDSSHLTCRFQFGSFFFPIQRCCFCFAELDIVVRIRASRVQFCGLRIFSQFSISPFVAFWWSFHEELDTSEPDPVTWESVVAVGVPVLVSVVLIQVVQVRFRLSVRVDVIQRNWER